MPGRQSAFTLTELLLCLSIIVLVTAASSDNLALVFRRKSGAVIIEQLYRAMNFARHSAATTGTNVTMCRSSTGERCDGDWLQGVLVFTDSNHDHRINQQDRILRYMRFPAARGSLVLRSFPNRQYVHFTPLGFTRGQSGNFTWCPADGNTQLAQQLIFTRSGRPRLAQDRDNDGIREAANGKALYCN